MGQDGAPVPRSVRVGPLGVLGLAAALAGGWMIGRAPSVLAQAGVEAAAASPAPPAAAAPVTAATAPPAAPAPIVVTMPAAPAPQVVIVIRESGGGGRDRSSSEPA